MELHCTPGTYKRACKLSCYPCSLITAGGWVEEGTISKMCNHSSLPPQCHPLWAVASIYSVLSSLRHEWQGPSSMPVSTSWGLFLAGDEEAVPRPCSQIPVQIVHQACLLCALSPSNPSAVRSRWTWISKSGFVTLMMYCILFLYQITPKWLSWSESHILSSFFILSIGKR